MLKIHHGDQDFIMELTFLGTNAGVPSKDRNVTSMVLDLQNKKKVCGCSIVERRPSIRSYIAM